MTERPEFDPEVVAQSTGRREAYVAIPPDLSEQIDAEAEARVLGRRKLVEMILRQWLKEVG